jgi:hypothetical protein
MRIKFTVNEYSGRIGTFKRGDETEVSEDVGRKLINARIAHSVEEPPAPKSITTEAFAPPETTSLEAPAPKKPRGRPRKAK